MSFTGQLGTALSKPGSILLGSIGSSPLNVTVTDNLNAWSDATARQLGYFITNSDTITLSDSARAVLGLNRLTSDNADNWNDSISSFIIGVLRRSVADTLRNYSDGVEVLRQNTSVPQFTYKPNEVAYIRRYLNDVVVENLGSFSFPAQVIYKANEVTYIRRYLNDV